ncbi:MAG: hypothetical protein O2852_07665 [Bacteroidetes bacterium]|nr:hypothetical protein [Bacteroidota bacterium]MDA0981213.1 hypothetical protein [Bacteroidota bacterium]
MGLLSLYSYSWAACGGLEPSYICLDGSLACDECSCLSATGFSPTINIIIDNSVGGSSTNLIYTMSQDAGESEILSSLVVSDAGSFNLSGLLVGDVIGTGSLLLELYAGNVDIASILVVSNINNGNYTVFSHVTASNSPAYSVGDIAGGFVISNAESGINIYTEVPEDEDYITEAYDMSLTFVNLFVNPADGYVTFTSTLTSELSDVDVQVFGFE